MQPFDLLERLEQLEALDPVLQRLVRGVRRVLPPGRVRDALHGVWLGHPTHPALVLAPLGCFVGAGVLDALPGEQRAARTLIAAGLLTTPPAVAAGIADWSELHEQQQRVGAVHAMVNGGATTLYLASLAARLAGRSGTGRLLGYAGLGLVSLGGLLGGHLAYRQAAGVNHAEHVPHRVPTDWRSIASFDDLPDGDLVARDVDGESVLVLRRGAHVHVLADVCAHLSGPLHEGEVVDVDSAPCVVCPWHGSTFRLADGGVVRGPATAPQPVFDVRVEAGKVLVRLPGAG